MQLKIGEKCKEHLMTTETDILLHFYIEKTHIWSSMLCRLTY